jgi:rare lipoprotein A
MKRPVRAIALAVFAVLAAAPQGEAPRGEAESGIASWYGHPYHGRTAASGEIYDMETLTAAHPSLPFNTRVRVLNLDNNRSVEVRIMDRGPFIDGRIIDLSHAAARAIGMVNPGIVPVRLEIVGKADTEPADRFAVQVGSYIDRHNAERVRTEMQSRYGVARLALRDGEPMMWRVWVGSETTEVEARALCRRVREQTTPGEKNAFIVRAE